MDEKLLTALGLSAKEVKIYKAVLKAREIKPANLAKAVGIKRTTCYHLAQSLVEKGLLIENTTPRPLTFSVAQATDFSRVLADERKQLERREKLLKRFSAELSRESAAEESYPVPTIRFVTEEKIASFIDSRAFAWEETMLKTDPVMWGYQDHSYVQHYADVIDRYWKKAHKHIGLKMLTNQSAAPTEKKLARKWKQRVMKVWKNGDAFLSGIWIAGDYLIMINCRQHPFYLVETHDAALAHDLRELFKSLWPLV